MTEFFQQVVSGLASGGVYASLALALVLIHRATGVINFAQGEMATFTTYIAWTLYDQGLPFWLMFVVTIAFAFAFGVTLERVVVRQVGRSSVLAIVMVTIGLLVLLNGGMGWIWGPDFKAFPSPFPNRGIDVAGVTVSLQDLGVIGVTIVMVALLAAFFRFTKLGLALRAAAVNPEASRLVGVRVGWMLGIGWGLAAVLGAVSGMLVAPTAFLEPNMMQIVIVYAFAAAILGGINSPVGAVAGGLLLGVALNLIGTYADFLGEELRLPVALGILLAVLLVRPAGLFDRVVVKRV